MVLIISVTHTQTWSHWQFHRYRQNTKTKEATVTHNFAEMFKSLCDKEIERLPQIYNRSR